MRNSLTLPEIIAADRPVWSPVSSVVVSAIVIALLATGIWFRVVDLDHVPGLNGDEAWSGVQAVKFLKGEPVAWRTPTGNPLNVFFWGPLVALHTVFPPSIGLLRSVSVVSGLLAIGANLWLCRRVFDRTTAVVSTVLLTVLPVMIAYSRFAWDSSQTPLVSVLVVYSALAIARSLCVTWSNWLILVLAFLAAVWVHPTNVFLAPLVVALVAPWEKLRAARPQLVGAIVLLAAVVFFVRSTADIGRFTLDLTRLFSGTTIYRFISGGVQSNAFDWSDALTWFVFAVALWGFVKCIEHSNNSLDRRLGVGLLLSLVAFFVVAGPRGVQPHFERYAMWSIVPVALAVSRGIAWWLRSECRYRVVARVAALAVAVGLLFTFERLYFHVFETTGGQSHLAFRTNEIDPKQRALQEILAHSKLDRNMLIVGESWWTYWPLAYLSAVSDRVRVVTAIDYHADRSSFVRDEVWFADLAKGQEGAESQGRRESDRAASPMHVTRDRANRAVVLFWKDRAPVGQVRSR